MRNQTVDIAKGIAGILVVLGHAMAFRYADGWLLQLTHLSTPLFVFFSGVFLNIDRPFFESVIRKADGLLKPYLAVLLVLGMVYAAMGALLLPYIVGVLYATGPTIALVPLWFLPHLFICLLAGIAILQLCKRLALPRYGYVFLLFFLLMVGQQCLDIIWREPLQPLWWRSMLRPATHWPGLPWSLDVLPLTLVFLLAGYVFSSQVKNFRIQCIPLLLIFCGVGLSIQTGYAEVDINRRVYRDSFFASFFVFGGIYLVLSCASMLSSVIGLAKILAYIGKNFLVILLLHLLVLRLLFRQAATWLPEWSAWHMPLVFISGLLISILLVAVVQHTRWLSLLLLPIKRSGAAR